MIIALRDMLLAQTTPDLENGFKNYGSYHSSDIDTVDLKSGNLMVHISMPWTYPQRGSAINPKNLLTMSSKTWQTKCVNPDNTGNYCFWTPGIWRDQQVATAGSGLGFDHTSDLSLHRTWGYQTDTFNNVFYFSAGYSVNTPDGGSHNMAASPGAALDPNGDPMAFDAIDTSGFHVDLSNPNATDGTPDAGIVTDRHGNHYVGGWFTQPNCRAVFDNQFPGNSSSKSCEQATRLSSITDTNGNVFAANDTMGRPFHTFSSVSNGADTSWCVLNGLTFSSSSIMSYAGPNGATNQAKLCYATVNIATAFGVANVAEAQSVLAINNGSPATATVLVTLILPDSNNAISASSPKWVFNYDSYINLTYIGLPTGGSISYSWQTLNVGFPCDKISRVVASRTLTDNNGHSYPWNYHWGPQGQGPSAPATNSVTDPLGNDTIHTFTDVTGHGACLGYETTTQLFKGPSGSGQLLKQVDTTYAFLTGVVPISITTTLLPSNKVNLVAKIYDTGRGPNQPIFGNIVSEKEYDWGQGSPGALLRETDTTYQWQKDSRYLTAHLLDLPASIVVISPDPNGNPKASCSGWDSSGNAITKACMAETDYTYDEAAYLTGYEATVGALPAGTHSAAPNPVRGNLTTVSHWLNTTNSFVVSHTNWYDTGEPHQAIDPLGHTTTHSYDPVYAGAYATQTCSPSTGSTAHCVSGTYDFQTGAVTSLTDENGQTSNYSYDSMGRIFLAQAPADPGNGGVRAHTSLTFSPANIFPLSVQRSKSITTSLSDSATNFFDGLGRMYQDQHVLPNGTATVDTIFDALGHATSVSNPYFATSDATYGVTTNLYDALGRAYQTTKQDGSVSSVDFSGGTCVLATDEAGHQRKSCSDAIGRLVEVDEPNPNAAAHVVINGQEQTNPQPGAPGKGWVTIAGTEGSVITDPCADQQPLPGHPPRSCPTTVWDTGSLTATVNGFSKTANYQQGSTAASMASDLASAFHLDSSSPVDAAVDPANTAKVNFTARAVGVFTNYSVQLSPAGDFRFDSSSGAALTGGRDATTNPDSGSVTITVNGVAYSTSYSAADNDGSGVASRVASLVNAGPYANASALGGTVSLTGKTSGPAGGYSLSASYTWNTTSFAQPSFTTSADASLSNIGNSPYVTLYAYDALGNLLRVDQKGTAPTDSTQWRSRTFTYDSLSRLLTATNPESGTITYLYDADGELLMKASPAPNPNPVPPTQPVSYCYDELHRVTKRDYQFHVFSPPACPITTPVVTYTYDSGTNAKGHLTSLTDQAGTASYSYDILGRLTTETRTLTGANNAAIPKSLSYDYNLDGSLKTLHYPSGAAVTYAPDSAGRVLSAIDSGSGINYVTGATYGPDSTLTGFVSGNSGTFAGITSAFSYNKRLQPVAMSANAPSQTVFSIGYDFHVGNGTTGADNGNVWGITNYKDTTRSQTFAYDALNRLTSAQNAGTDCTVNVLGGNKKFWGNNYGYDAWGNLLSKSVAKCSAENLSVVAGTNNRLTGAYLYDAAGNMTHDATSGLNYTFDQENRITGAGGYTYTYDGDGNRVRKSNGNLAANGTLYWAMTPGIVAETDLAGTLKSEYVFFDGERVARRDGPTGSGGVFYYFSDHLKTASVITDSAGVIKAESDYYPWGGELQFTNNDTNDYKFTGKERDETGLDYFGARYYSNGLGRFSTPDYADDDDGPVSIPFYDPLNPQSLNLFSYAHNNPITNSDPDGHDCVVQTRTSDKTESVSVSSGTCNGVKVGDGQSKSYVPGTVTGVKAGADGKSIDIGYTPYEGGGTGVFSAAAAPIPDRPGLAYGYNAAGYHTLGVAGATMNDPRTYALWAGASAVGGMALVGSGVIGGGGGLTTIGEWMASDLTDHAVGRLAAHGISPAEARAAIEAAKQAGNFVQTMGRYGPQIRYVANGIKVVVATTGANAGKIITAFHK
jgi:RHS repeat-associated protein